MANQPLRVKITGLTGYLIVRYAEADTPTAYLGTTAPLPFPVNHTYDILNLRRVVHNFEFWQSNDGISFNQQIDIWPIDVAKQELPVIENYYYVVGGPAPTDPASGQGSLRDARLLNKTYVVFEKGTGPLVPIEDFTDRSDAGGGWDFVTGYTFNEGGRYLVEVQDKIVVDNPETTSGGGGISDVILVDESVPVLITDHYNKLIVANYATATTADFRLTSLVTIPDGTHLRFSTQQGNQQYMRIVFQGIQTVRLEGKDRNWIYLGKGESIEFLIKGGVCYVLDDKTGYKNVGRRILGDIIELNTVLRDGAIYTRATAGRLIDWVLDNFNPLQIRTFSDWNSDPTFQKFFAWDAGTQSLKVPNSFNMYGRAVPSLATTPGAYQSDMVGPLNQTLSHASSGGGTAFAGVIGGGTTFGPYDATQGLIGLNTGTETRGKGELLLPLVRI